MPDARNLPMPRRASLVSTAFVVLVAVSAGATQLSAQDPPAKRVANIVGVAVEEYSQAIDGSGKMVSELEYGEARSFLTDAREVAQRMSGERAALVGTLIDSLIATVEAKRPPAELDAIHARFIAALGADAALDLPTRLIDLNSGRTLYEAHCAACHGVTGQGDGPGAAGLEPPPPALGDREMMHDVSPAHMFRVTTVGIAGTSMVGWSSLTPNERWNVIAYVNGMRAPPAAAPGEGLFIQRCASCHGVGGAGDGVLASALSKLPLELSSFAWQAERSDKQIEEAIRLGMAGTSMPASRDLAEEDIRALVAHVRSLSLTDSTTQEAIGSTGAADGAVVSERVRRTLEEALAAARAGRKSDAGDLAFDAYIAFEPLETRARSRNPGLVSSMERHFADFKGAVRANDLRGAERSRNAIEAGMPAVVELTRATKGSWGGFLESFLIILREGVEAILVVGVIVAFLIKTGNRKRLRAIWIGVGAALAASAVTAYVLATALRALPATREIIEGGTMLVAVVVLFSVSYWLVSKVEAAKWQQFIREKVNTALAAGGGNALAFTAFLAVYREGAETALFLQVLFNEGAALPLTLGIATGFAALAVIFVLFHKYGLKIPLRPFFAVTSALLYYMAFVFMGKGIRELQEGNVVPITVLPGWPHVDLMGIFPSVETLLAQALLLVLLLFALIKTFWPTRSIALPTIPASRLPIAEPIEDRIALLERKVNALQQSIVGDAEPAGDGYPAGARRD